MPVRAHKRKAAPTPENGSAPPAEPETQPIGITQPGRPVDPAALQAVMVRASNGSAAADQRPSIEDTPLRMIVMQISQLVIERGSMAEADLGAAYAQRYGTEISRGWHRTLKRFAWTAKGKRYLNLDGDTWLPGSEPPRPDARYGEWTFRQIIQRAGELLRHDDDPFETLLAEVYGGTRAPKLAMSLVGTAINQAKQDRQLRL
jgi:hypothetical protein